ncbi:MAG: Enolase [Chlamydiia bacterium]|nr:Enolase [Chlamydiia bacterium]
MGKIESIKGYELLDSRGNPTVGCEVISDSGFSGFAIVPSGASTGEHEAFEMRDNDLKRYHGKGVKKAIKAIEGPLFDVLKGLDIFDQRTIDELMIELDGTDNKARLGANSILAISMAVARCAAAAKDKELYEYLGNNEPTFPTPMMNIINGGAHASNTIDFQEFMILPHGFVSFAQKVRAGSEIFHELKKLLTKKGQSTAVGDEGGFAPNLATPEKALDIIIEAIKKAGYKPKDEVAITLDCAASDFYCNKGYFKQKSDPLKGYRSSSEQIGYLEKLLAEYPIVSIEDGLDENDWKGWKELTKKCKGIQIVGDDLFVTNKKFLERGIKEGIANSILIKLNQIGTVTETLDTINLAKKNNYSFIISHRSGDTEDSFIADLAIATNAPYIKTGSLSRSERVCKYNRLMFIEQRCSGGQRGNPPS